MGNALSTSACRKSSEFIWTVELRASMYKICFRIILIQYEQHTDRITISQSIQEHNTKKLFHRWNKSCPVSHNRFYYYPWFMFELHLVLDNLKHKIYNSVAIHAVIVELQYCLTSPQVHSVDQTSKIWDAHHTHLHSTRNLCCISPIFTRKYFKIYISSAAGKYLINKLDSSELGIKKEMISHLLMIDVCHSKKDFIFPSYRTQLESLDHSGDKVQTIEIYACPSC